MTTVLDMIRMADLGVAAQAKQGHNYVLVSCPFHGDGMERTPSCSVSTDKPVFFCHACQESGHLSRLLAALGLDRSVSTPLIESAGLSGRNYTPRGRAAITHAYNSGLDPYRGRFILDEDLLDMYRHAPRPFLDVGFQLEVLRHFEVGVDLSHARITFPIRNLYGQLVGISGRTLLDADPRYKIYREELVTRGRYENWHIPDDYTIEDIKRATMWHAHIVYPFLIEQEETLIITEGFKACMWVYQAGYPSVTALIGAYLSDLHANLIARSCQHVVLFLDNNEAGVLGTLEAAIRLEKVGVRPWIAKYPDERGQPDDLSAIEIEHAIVNAESFIKWRRE